MYGVDDWLELDESERLARVEEAHVRDRSPVGQNARVHAAMHVIVENRLAAKDAPVIAAFERFRAAGVERHETVHALASVVAQQLFDVTAEKRAFTPEDDLAFGDLDPDDWR